MLPLPQKSNSPPLLLHLIAGQLETVTLSKWYRKLKRGLPLKTVYNLLTEFSGNYCSTCLLTEICGIFD